MIDGSDARVVAVGGTRTVPAPDAVAAEYLLLALRLDQHTPGLVDGYFGPASLKARVDLEQLRSPADLREDAGALRERVLGEVAGSDRRDWLIAQLRALETQAAILAGASFPYVEHVRRCFDWEPVRRDEAIFDAAAAELAAMLPGDPGHSVADRLADWDARFAIDPDRLEAVAAWLIERFRGAAAAEFGLPDGEDLRISLVRDQPWSGYNWFEGGGRSRVDLNLDLPIRAADLVHVIAHEAYPGHHLEHAWKEAELVATAGWLEASILLINTPECLISEGLADLGHRFVVPPGEEAELLVELYGRAGLAVARDPAAARDAAAIDVAVRAPRRRLAEVRVNAALLRHADGASHEATFDYLCRVGRSTAPRAAKSLEFIEHPVWRTYGFVYHEGEALLSRWLDAVPPAGWSSRFGRLFHEQLTPGTIAAEIAAAPDASAAPGPGFRPARARD